MSNKKKIKNDLILEIAGKEIHIGSDSVNSEGQTSPHIIEILRKASGKGFFALPSPARDNLKSNDLK